MKTSIFAIIAAVSTSAAFAEPLYKNYAVGMERLSFDNGDLDIWNYQIDYEAQSRTLSYGVSLNRAATNRSDNAVARYEGFLGYRITPELNLGAHVAGVDSAGENQKYYGLYGEYRRGPLDVALNFTRTDDNNDVVVTSVGASYEVTPQAEVYGFFAKGNLGDETISGVGAEYDNGTFDVSARYTNYAADLKILNLTASYDFGNRFRALGSLTSFDLDEDGRDVRLNVYKVGAGYQVYDRMWLNGTVGRIAADGLNGSVETMGLNVTYEFGRSGGIASETRSRSLGFDNPDFMTFVGFSG